MRTRTVGFCLALALTFAALPIAGVFFLSPGAPVEGETTVVLSGQPVEGIVDLQPKEPVAYRPDPGDCIWADHASF